MSFRTESFDGRRHAVEGFSSGRPALDEWLRRYAGQAQRRDLARTFVATDGAGAVLGYYTLVATTVRHEAATGSVSRGASERFPIPACLIARLAADRARQGKRLGSMLLFDVFKRVLAASEHARCPQGFLFKGGTVVEPRCTVRVVRPGVALDLRPLAAVVVSVGRQLRVARSARSPRWSGPARPDAWPAPDRNDPRATGRPCGSVGSAWQPRRRLPR